MIKGNLDLTGVNDAFDRLAGPGKESLARRMGVSAGRVIRDEAILRAPMGKEEAKATAQFGGSLTPGLLKSAMYVAFNKKASTAAAFTYSVSWNRIRAPHGHLIEFGHWRPYAVYFSQKYQRWLTDKSRKLPGQGKWVAARPFLSVAFDSHKDEAYKAAVATGKIEFPKILRGDVE